MEIIDRPLSEIIKEQKIGESLRKGRHGGGRGRQQNPRGTRSTATGGEQNRRRNGRRNRLRLRPRRPFGLREGYKRGTTWDRKRRYAMDIIDNRRNRSVKSGGPQRRGLTAFERNDRLRTTRRREALSRIRSRFSRN